MGRRASTYVGIALVSAAMLMFELTLTRLFSVAEWYHFAFLSVSVALLGYASSGTLLSILTERTRERVWPFAALTFPLSIVGAYLVINNVPFDSYQLGWAPVQLLYLAIYYLGLVVPFAISGWLIAYQLSTDPAASNRSYAANLVGSAAGTLGLLVALPVMGGEGTVSFAAGLAALGAAFLMRTRPTQAGPRATLSGLALATALACIGLTAVSPEWLELRLSPYKSLSYALLSPDARLAHQRWNTSSRVDVVESPHVHSAPGMSLTFAGALPPQHGLTVDGGNLSAITRRVAPDDEAFLGYLPSSLLFRLRPKASALLIQPRGGLDVAVALHHGVGDVTVVEDNALIVSLLGDTYGPFVRDLYRDPRVSVSVEGPRSALRRGERTFDVILFSLSDGFHPLTSGAYSLAENPLYTVESARDALLRLEEGGILTLTRWLQDPPSESLRTAALLIAALERVGVESPEEHLMAFRSWSTMTLMVSSRPFDGQDVAILLSECERLGYDLVHYPGMQGEEANQHSIVPDAEYYLAVRGLLDAQDRRAFYRDQYHDVSPPTDDRPFFGHHFRWRQVPDIVAKLGSSWQPFGGSGFLLVWVLLAIAILICTFLVLVPLLLRGAPSLGAPRMGRLLAYFGALGAGYLLVEMPLMQQFILYLGQPSLSFIVVLSALLLASGVGSMLSPRLPLRRTMIVLVFALIVYPPALGYLFDATLAWPLAARVIMAMVGLMPLGVLMGVPFASGIRIAEGMSPGITPWLWAINGSSSVVCSIVATIVALSGGYRLVLALATLCYAGAAIALWRLARPVAAEASAGR